MARFIVDIANIDPKKVKDICVAICDRMGEEDLDYGVVTALCIDDTNTNQFYNSDDIEGGNSNKLTLPQIIKFNEYYCGETGENPLPLIEEKELNTNQYHELRNKIFQDLVSCGVTSDEDENFKAFDEVLGSSLNVNWENEEQPTTYNRDEVLKICKNMTRFGGSFIKNLSETIHKADHDNLKILIKGFDKYFKQYLNL